MEKNWGDTPSATLKLNIVLVQQHNHCIQYIDDQISCCVNTANKASVFLDLFYLLKCMFH